MAKSGSGIVSVVLVNFRGTDDTLQAIKHLREVDWPAERLEIVVVENGSGDDSAERLRTEAPGINLVVSTTNEGFAGGCNLGVAASAGEVIALLNNDARPDAGWIRAAMNVFSQSSDVGAVASKVLDWDGELVDYIGASMSWYGMGYKPFTGERPPRVPDRRADVLFGTGSAMFVRRTAYEQLGGFDERYFMFFEDVDFGWRLNLAGWRFVYEPASLAYHKHHASMSAFGSFKETYLLERNALFTLYKNVGEQYLGEALPAAIALANRRAISRAGLDSTSFDLRSGASNEPTMNVDKVLVATSFAVDQFVEQLPTLTRSRKHIQANRKLPESRIRRLFNGIDAPVMQQNDYLRGYENLVYSFDLVDVPDTTKVVVVTGDPIGTKLAGPAIRAWNMAQALSERNDVVLVSLTSIDASIDVPFGMTKIAPGDDRAFSKLERWADIIIFQGHAMAVFDSLRRSDKILVADIYDPMHLEQLEQARELPREQWERQVRDATAVLNEQLARADFFLAASDRQKMFWLGQLAAHGRLNPDTYERDPDFDGLIGVVPFGVPSEPALHTRDAVKGVVPGIGKEDKLLLWGGGLYNWFDPLSLIRAVAELGARRPEVRLFFQGTKHPHPGVPEMAIVAEARELARDLGVLNSLVFFNESWVDYADRQNYLTEADVGVSTHHAHVETTFSFRTRILDYLWAGLPMVVSGGDHFAEVVEREELGVAVTPGDVGGLADALERVLFDDDFAGKARANVERVRDEYRWDRTLTPLIEFVDRALPAADRRNPESLERRRRRRLKRRCGPVHDIGLVFHYLRTSGPRTVVEKIRRRLSRH